MNDQQKVIFLDRDGVINFDSGYVGHWKNFKILPGVLESLKSLVSHNFDIYIVTNQSGIARAYYSLADFRELTLRMTEFFSLHGVAIRETFYCPHHPEGIVDGLAIHCNCRKPLPGMFFQAAQKHGVQLKQAIMVGDRLTDVQAALAAGITSIYGVCSPGSDLTSNTPGLLRCENSLIECVEHMLR